MLESRELQKRSGRIIPQTNEEYGYEDHYPKWAAPGSDSADALRRESHGETGIGRLRRDVSICVERRTNCASGCERTNMDSPETPDQNDWALLLRRRR
jgi:hypothetical protein